MSDDNEKRYRTIALGEPGWAVLADINGKDVSIPGAEFVIWLSYQEGKWVVEMYVDTEEEDGLNYGLTCCRTPLEEMLADVIGEDEFGEMTALRAALAEAIEKIDEANESKTRKQVPKK